MENYIQNEKTLEKSRPSKSRKVHINISTDIQCLSKKREQINSAFQEQLYQEMSSQNIAGSHSVKSDLQNTDVNSAKVTEANIQLNEYFSEDCLENDDSNYILELEEKKNRIYVEKNYFSTRQIYLSADMRCVLCDWMMMLSSQLNFKRETFHLAVTLLDIALSRLNPIRANKLQLVGVCCLIISAKFEEIACPNIKIFAYSAGEAYEVEEIIYFEQCLLNVLGWNLKYPTLSLWGNMITLRWDNWVHINKDTCPAIFNQLPIFRVEGFNSFSFNRLFRCIDLFTLDFEYFNLEPNKFVCAVLYLVVGVFVNSFNEEFVETRLSSQYGLSDLDDLHELNTVIDGFLSDYIGIGLNEIADYIILVSPYFAMTNGLVDQVYKERIHFVSY